MAERPFIVPNALVRHILDAEVTQLRLPMRTQPETDHNGMVRWRSDGGFFAPMVAKAALSSAGIQCPFGDPGDRIWLQEPWKSGQRSCADTDQDDDHECSAHCQQTYVYYEATPRVGYRPVPDRARITYLHESSPLTEFHTAGFSPAILMPRWASRVTLHVVGWHPARLQDLSEEEAEACGVRIEPADQTLIAPKYDAEGECFQAWSEAIDNYADLFEIARASYRTLWNMTMGDQHPWESNPWCWVVAVKRVVNDAEMAAENG